MKRVFKYFLLFLAAFIFSFGFNVFLRPAGIAPGGLTGLSLIINYLLPALPVGTLSLIFNLPLFWIGFKNIGGEFVLSSVITSVLISIMLDLYPFFPRVQAEPLLCAIFGGVIMGGGMGLAFLAGGSTGGVDILIRVLRKKYPQLSIGQLLLIFDVLIVITAGLIYKNINNALYAMATMYVASIALDAILYGLNYAKCALVITDQAKRVNDSLHRSLTRGTTLIPCYGGYGNNTKYIVLCAVKRGQLTALKEAVWAADKNAFVIMCEATEVLGLGFKSHSKNSL